MRNLRCKQALAGAGKHGYHLSERACVYRVEVRGASFPAGSLIYWPEWRWQKIIWNLGSLERSWVESLFLRCFKATVSVEAMFKIILSSHPWERFIITTSDILNADRKKQCIKLISFFWGYWMLTFSVCYVFPIHFFSNIAFTFNNWRNEIVMQQYTYFIKYF